MKNPLIFLIVILSTSFSSFAQGDGVDLKASEAQSYTKAFFKQYLNKQSVFLNENNETIGLSEFDKLSSKQGLIGVMAESNTFKIVPREDEGVIKNPEKVYDLLMENSKIKFNRNGPIVVEYHPGVDGCSSTGTKDKKWIKNIFDNFEKDLMKVAATNPLYICETFEGLEKYEGIVSWNKDPEGLFQELFFPYQAPCGSFAVMGANGNYYVYHGEYSKEHIITVVKNILKVAKKNVK